MNISKIIGITLFITVLSACHSSSGGAVSSGSDKPTSATYTVITNTISSVQVTGATDEVVTATATAYDANGANPTTPVTDADATVDTDFDLTLNADGVTLPVDPGATGSGDLVIDVDLEDGDTNVLTIPILIEPSF
ncbi:MAG: hypothetical protein HRU15_10720 [Planctomycetes bacterium]|nr:hypothetical protein [Planctomycetota bacterium]